MNIRNTFFTLTIAVLASALLLAAGCATKQRTGVVIGAAAGAVVGHQFGSGRGQTAMTIIGAVAGAMVGGAIGKQLDQNDRHRVAYALENNRTGQTTSWVNPDTGQRYAVTPTRTTTQYGDPCRTFVFKSHDQYGQPYSTTRVACRTPNGSWQVQE